MKSSISSHCLSSSQCAIRYILSNESCCRCACLHQKREALDCFLTPMTWKKKALSRVLKTPFNGRIYFLTFVKRKVKKVLELKPTIIDVVFKMELVIFFRNFDWFSNAVVSVMRVMRLSSRFGSAKPLLSIASINNCGQDFIVFIVPAK